MTRPDASIFTLVAGTTSPERAAVVREHCCEGSHVELRREVQTESGPPRIEVWLPCKALLGLVTTWRQIGHVPPETAVALLSLARQDSTVVGLGTVRTVYAPLDRDESVVTVEIRPVS